MDVYIPLGIILVLLTYLSKYKDSNSRTAFLIAFVILFVFSAIRYEFGPDYFNYREQFEQLKSRGVDDYLDFNNHFERGFLLFFNLFDSYFVFIIVHTFIWLGIFYWFFKNNVKYSYLYIVVLLMFINRNFCIQNCVAFRSSLASSCFIIGLSCFVANDSSKDIPFWGKIRLLNKNKYANLVTYILFVLIGAQFHTSLLVAILFPFFTNGKKIKKSNLTPIIILFYGLAIVSVSLKSIVTQPLTTWLLGLAPELMDRYTEYMDKINDAGGSMGAIVQNLYKAVLATPILIALTVERDKKYIRLMQFAILFLLLLLIIDENLLARFTMCFFPVVLVALLRSFSYVNTRLRILSLSYFCLISLFLFYQSMQSAYSVSFFHYQTIFSAPYWQ